MKNRTVFTVSLQEAGQRLDAVLKNRLHQGLRHIRRLIGQLLVTVNGNIKPASYKTRIDDILVIQETEATPFSILPTTIFRDSDYCFYFKPSRLHTAEIAGKNIPSLESWIKKQSSPNSPPQLLQRLDYKTCGIICAALNSEAASNFRLQEKSAQCRKFYLCLIDGRPTRAIIADSCLKTSRCKKTIVLRTKAELERTTGFLPLPSIKIPENIPYPATWAIAMIHQGHRHQIRAHAASIGHPLSGDYLYGSKNGEDFRLRHFYMEFPGYRINFTRNISGSFLFPEEIEKNLNDITGKWNRFFGEHNQ